MRTPNSKCIICDKPIYRKPSELAEVNFVCCRGCRSAAYKRYPNINALANLEIGKGIQGINHLNGIPKSPESNLKRSISHKAYWATHPEQLKERGEKTQGINHYRWNGGISQLNQSIRLMTEHRKWMDKIKARDKRCLECNSKKDLESHHITPLSTLIEGNGITSRDEARGCPALWDLNNGLTLCQPCHYEVHGRHYAD